MRFQYLSFPPLVSPQLLACTVIAVQYLDFRFSSQQLLAFILVSMSNFPSPTCLSLTNFLRSPGFNIYRFTRFSQHLLACILFQYLNFPHPVPVSCFRHSFLGPKNSPCVSQQFVVMYLHLVSISRPLGFTPHLSTTFGAHPVSISNFPFPLCASQFPASISLHT